MTFVKLEDVAAKLEALHDDGTSIDGMIHRGELREALRSLPTDDGWEDIATAPRDGRYFIARNADHHSFGSFVMMRNVRHKIIDGDWQIIDNDSWLIVGDIEPDLEDGYETPAQCSVPFSIAADKYNKSVRYEWRPLPAPPSE